MSVTMLFSSCNDLLKVDSPSSFDSNYVFSNSGDAKKNGTWRICHVCSGFLYFPYVECLDAEH